jgi:hypothetical protein
MWVKWGYHGETKNVSRKSTGRGRKFPT